MVKTNLKKKLINLKVSDEDYRLIKGKADLYEEGNISLWLRKQGRSDPNGFVEIKNCEWVISDPEPIEDVVYASHKKT